METGMTLREWCDIVSTTSAGAAEIEQVIRRAFLKIEESGLHTRYEWRLIGDLAGIPTNWPGYRGNVNEVS